LFISKTTLTFIEVEFISFASNNKNIRQAIYTMKDLEFVSNGVETPRHKTNIEAFAPTSGEVITDHATIFGGLNQLSKIVSDLKAVRIL
jgi:hypothetical protein